MQLLDRLSADHDSEEDESGSEDEQESKSSSSYAKKAIGHLASRYYNVYAVKDRKDFADGWQRFTELTATIDKATQAKQPVMGAKCPVTLQKTTSRVPKPHNSHFGPWKPTGLYGYGQHFA